jgi:hypothetical protein
MDYVSVSEEVRKQYGNTEFLDEMLLRINTDIRVLLMSMAGLGIRMANDPVLEIA